MHHHRETKNFKRPCNQTIENIKRETPHEVYWKPIRTLWQEESVVDPRAAKTTDFHPSAPLDVQGSTREPHIEGRTMLTSDNTRKHQRTGVHTHA